MHDLFPLAAVPLLASLALAAMAMAIGQSRPRLVPVRRRRRHPAAGR